MFRIVRAGKDLTAQREHIIQELNTKIQFTQLDATLVFDSQFQEGLSTRSHLDQLEIIFTAQGETADEFILNELKKTEDARFQTVVTSDKKLAWSARRRGAKTESVENFISVLNRRYENKKKQKRNQEQNKLTAIPQIVRKTKKEKDITHAPLNPKAVPEECFDFYLQEFEKLLSSSQENSSENPLHPAKIKKLTKKKPSTRKKEQKPKQKNWLEAFERTLNQDEIEETF